MTPEPDKVVFTRTDYWDEACRHLAKKDRVMKRLIPQFGVSCLQSLGEVFKTLARMMVCDII
jgi:DNA-3-methyladenine glycosylase II